ncbi:AI-2E family transporter [Ramlibacter sp. MAHUQ-53]|uniref:AI-2E family transporter n=1 Tax=unclassified Ramlibacter TaxID=2617605 RepID=UPI0036294D42
MSRPDPHSPPSLEHRNLAWLAMALSAGFVLIVWPLFGAVLWAVFIAIVFDPLHRRVEQQVGGRSPNLAAFLTLTLVVLIVILPLIMVATAVVQETADVVQRVRSGQIDFAGQIQALFDALPAWVRSIMDRFGLFNLAALQRQLSTLLAGSGQFITTHLVGLGQGTLDFVVALFVMLYVLYFLLRDGRQLAARIVRTAPLEDDHVRQLMAQFVTVVRATVKGNLLIALVQGLLGGVAFAFLGLPGALLWGTLMALLSLLPAVGAAMVWGPVAAWFVFNGQVLSALGLTLWGVLVIGLVDNFLRPILVGKDTRMPDYLVLVATLGGIAVFGINGFVIGPVIAAMFLVAWNLLSGLRRRPDGGSPGA